MSAWIYLLRPPRQPFIDDMTDEERAIMSEHADYLHGLLEQGRLVLAGPSLGPVFGVAVFEARDEADARAVMEADPAVKSGLQKAELSPFRVTFLRGRD
jgi:uncharacterized protein YciI